MNSQRTIAPSVHRTRAVRLLLLVMAAGTLGSQGASSAQGLQAGSPWPMFRQNALHTGQGVGSGAPGMLKWKFTTGFQVESSPAIGTDGTIYVGSWDNNLYAINPANGSEKWEFTTGSAVVSSPAIGMDGTVYVGSWDYNVYAINPADGIQKWQFTTGKAVDSSPAIGSDGTVYVGSEDGNVYAINPADGSQKWKFTTGSPVWSSPAIGADGTIYVGTGVEDAANIPSPGYLYALNPADGSQKWKFATQDAVESSPAIGADGTIYVESDYFAGENIHTTPFFSGTLYAINPADGTQKWACGTGEFSWTHPGSSPVIGIDGTIYVESADSNLYAIDPNGSQKWQFTGVGGYSSPAIGADGTLYVGSDDDNVCAINPADGSLVWKFTTGGWVDSSPAIGADGTIYVGSSVVNKDGTAEPSNLYAIGSATQSIALSSSSNPADPGQPITFTAAVSAVAPATGTPTGTVTFLDGATTLGTQALSYGVAAFSTASLAGGSHSITASYSGDPNFAAALSPALTQWVGYAPSVTLTSSQNPSSFGQAVTFTATVSAAAANGTPTGTVTFLDGTSTSPTVLGTVVLSNGQAALSFLYLSVGSHPIAASYSGDSLFMAANSTALTQFVSQGAAGGPQAGSPWPQLGQNAMHTGRGVGGGAPGTLKWKSTAEFWSPAIGADGTIYGGWNGFLYAINPTDGSQKWTFTTRWDQESIPAIGADGAIYVASSGMMGGNYYGDLQAINPADGTQKWDIPSFAYLNSSPAIGLDGTIYVGSSAVDEDGNAEPSNLYAIDPANGSEKWAFTAGSWVDSTPAVGADGTVYVESEDGNLTALNPADGSEKWRFSGAGGPASPAIGADGTIYAASGNSDSPVASILYAINPADGSEKWKFATGNSVYSSPAIGVDGTIYVGSDDSNLYAIDPADGTLKWKFTTGGGVYSSPMIGADGTIYVGSYDANLYAINPEDGSQQWKLAGAWASAIGADGTLYGGDCAVGRATSSVALTSSSNPAIQGEPITITATLSAVAPATGTPTGTVTLRDGGIALGTLTLVTGVASLSISTFSVGSHIITASYSGDSAFAAGQGSLTQTVSNVWIPVDISVGADDLSRVLWTYPDGRATLWSLDRTSGNYTQGPVFGPYDGDAWQATRIACGQDGISHILWNRTDGMLSLWWVGADNTYQSNVLYGPFAGWAATDIAVGSDNLVRILWTNVNDGRAVVWSVDANGNRSDDRNFYGPYPGYTAIALACGSDGLTRVLWSNPLGTAMLWMMNAQNQQQSVFIYTPYQNWVPADIDMGSDDLARVLWTNTVDGRAIVWSMDANGKPSNNTNFYGPFNAYTAQRVACGSDGLTRVTWLRGDGTLSFWHMAADNTMLTFNIYGPYLTP